MSEVETTSRHNPTAASPPSCPFCGKKTNLEDPDTLYPSGIFWRENEELGFRTYHRTKDRREGDGMVWSMHCPVPSGGCGAEIHGDTREEALELWSRRATGVSGASPQLFPNNRRPTFFLERFREALACMCGAMPPEDLCLAWLDETSEELTNWIGSQPGTPKWAQCIVTVEAAMAWADLPEEGAGHAIRG